MVVGTGFLRTCKSPIACGFANEFTCLFLLEQQDLSLHINILSKKSHPKSQGVKLFLGGVRIGM